ncbi:hypothetical protein SD457_15595 [Coprobacillaceae bacterium CR2/5/TPMF4]|nr:hypothetical protein SD457_15595 [Coprobacillaceae bacterium CR2/5/TPMF4]
MSLLEKLKDNQLFTKAQLPVVTYINEHSEEISKITIGQLAKRPILQMLQLLEFVKNWVILGFENLNISY